MPARISTIGKKFGRLKVLSEHLCPENKQYVSICRCDCGSVKTATSSNIRLGKTRSCGCLASELTARRNFVHGHSVRGHWSRTYNSYASMIQRCTNANYTRYMDYGGRGITVCKRWLESFSNFLEDMGERPNGLSLERKNNSRGYCKSNCIWETAKNQGRNTRRNHIITVAGFTGCISEVCERFGKNVYAVKQRIRRGWDAETAMFCFGKKKTRAAQAALT